MIKDIIKKFEECGYEDVTPQQLVDLLSVVREILYQSGKEFWSCFSEEQVEGFNSELQHIHKDFNMDNVKSVVGIPRLVLQKIIDKGDWNE